MKRLTRRRMRRLFAVLVLLAAPLFAVEVGEQLSVSVREAEVRRSPGFLAPVVVRLPYAAEVTVLEVRNDWVRVQVKADRQEGWLHGTAILPPKQVVMTPGGRSTGTVSTAEVALAGRGFNESVEREYREETHLDFAPVDAMEGSLVPVEELSAFLAEIGAGLEASDVR